MHCTILGMVKPTLFGGIGGKLREKMSNGYRNCNYHLFSFYFVKYLLNKTKNFIKNTPINRGNTPKYVFYIFFLCQVILGYNMDLTPIIFVGGGATVMKRFGQMQQRNVRYIEDIRANAKGFDYLGKIYLERVIHRAG